MTSPPKKNRWLITVVTVATVLVAVFIVVSLFVVRRYVEDGPSMEPTIKNGQQLIVSRGYSEPKHGDIIVFSQSELSKYGQSDKLNLVKRVIGLPGEQVKVSNGQVKVFNAAHPDGFNPDTGYTVEGQTAGFVNNTTIPQGDVFVLGDNRPDSLDSREFGPVPIKNIIGRVIIH